MSGRAVLLGAVLGFVLAAPASAAVTARLSAPSHSPTVGQPWKWTVTVVNAGAPARAKARVQLVAFGTVVGCWKNGAMQQCTGVKSGDLLSFVGRKQGTIRWTEQSRGIPLTLQVLLTAGGKTTKLRYAVTVR